MIKRTDKFYQIILIFFFSIWILIPFLNNNLNFYSEPQVSKTENRNLTKRPEFNIQLLDPYPAAFTDFFNDHIVFRNLMLKEHSNLSYYLFKHSPVPDQVDIGKDGWLYFGNNDKLIYQGQKCLSGDEIRNIAKELHRRAVYYKQKGIHFYFCFAPMKQEIYPEFLPNNYSRSPGGTQTDKIISVIKKDPVIPFIDIKSALLESKKYGKMYQKTDHHWSCKAGFYVYSAIMNRIKIDFPELKPLKASDITYNQVLRNGGTLANMIGFDEILKEDYYFPVIKNAPGRAVKKAGYPPPYWFAYKDEYENEYEIPDKTMPSLFVIRDSFFYYPMLFLQQNFSRTTLIWDAWMYGPNLELIDKEKPKIVLIMVYEQNVGSLLKYHIY